MVSIFYFLLDLLVHLNLSVGDPCSVGASLSFAAGRALPGPLRFGNSTQPACSDGCAQISAVCVSGQGQWQARCWFFGGWDHPSACRRDPLTPTRSVLASYASARWPPAVIPEAPGLAATARQPSSIAAMPALIGSCTALGS